MDRSVAVDVAQKRGAEDAGRYFKYIAEFVGFKPREAEIIRQTKPIIEKHLAEIVAKFYAHLLRYPPTRKLFLKKDGTIDQAYVELRMRHLTNFWLRTADGVFDDDYARYVDYVGRAHTSHGADPHIYIAERYVIGQVGFVQHAISVALAKELCDAEAAFRFKAEEAWDKLLMVILEMLARAYGTEREAESFDPLEPVDQCAVEQLAEQAFEREHDKSTPAASRSVVVARAEEIPDGERKIVQVDDLSIGVFHHNGKWFALRNWCLHRGGPVATGTLDGDTLMCPWHGFQYNIADGHLLVDPNAKLDVYPVVVRDGVVELQVPDVHIVEPASPLKQNEFRNAEVAPGKSRLVHVDGESVVVFNIDGTLYATQDACTHMGGPLSEGELEGNVVTCPLHGSRFDVRNGSVVRGPATRALKTFRVIVDGEIARVKGNQR